jgi:hypothetical protein
MTMMGRRNSQGRILRAVCSVVVCSLLLNSRVAVAFDMAGFIEAEDMEVDVDEEGITAGSAPTLSEAILQSVSPTSADEMRAAATLQLEEDEDKIDGESEADVPTLDSVVGADMPSLDNGPILENDDILETNDFQDNLDHVRAAGDSKRLWGSTGSSSDEEDYSEGDFLTIDSDPDADAAPLLYSSGPPILETDELQDNVDHARAAASGLPTSPSAVTPPTTTAGKSKGLWGSNGSSKDAGNSGAATGSPTDPNNSTSSPQQIQQQQQNLPFIPASSTSKQGNHQHEQKQHHVPPEGFTIAARVYTDPKDKLSHFDTDPAALTLTYWDCGVAGSTTPFISVKHAYFRHALAATTTVISSNDSYSYSSSSHSNSNPDSMHPVLVVALTPVTIEVNSGASQHFQPGDVILLEDVLRPGHKMRPSHQHSSQPKKDQHHPADVQLLFLTMPHPYHHTGKDHVSLSALASNSRVVQRNPCPNPSLPHQSETTSPLDSSGATSSSTIDRTNGATTGAGVQDSSSPPPSTSSSSRPYLVYQPPPSPFTQWWKHPNAGRWVVLGVAGLSTSTLMADFLGKTAPLWLAVGVGGGCFVAASTYSLTKAGDALWTAAEVWYYQRKLGESPSSSTTLDEEDEDGEQYHDEADRLLQQKTTEEEPVFTIM